MNEPELRNGSTSTILNDSTLTNTQSRRMLLFDCSMQDYSRRRHYCDPLLRFD